MANVTASPSPSELRMTLRGLTSSVVMSTDLPATVMLVGGAGTAKTTTSKGGGFALGAVPPCLRVGALTVHAPGAIVHEKPGFHTANAIYPAGYRATRIYWSAVRPFRRVLYVLEILDEGPGPDADAAAEASAAATASAATTTVAATTAATTATATADTAAAESPARAPEPAAGAEASTPSGSGSRR